MESAAVLIDFIEAYETILLGRTWQVAGEMGFPLMLLRLTLEASAFERRLVYKKLIGEPTCTLSAIVAGGVIFRRCAPLEFA